MAKHPTSSRVHREDETPDDAFVSGVKRSVSWAKTHDRQILIAGVAIAILVAVGAYWVSSQRRVEAEAATRLAEVQQAVASGNEQLAIRDLQTYLDTFGGAEAARPARLLLADMLLSADRPAEAVTALGDLPDDLEEPFAIAGARLLAAAREDMGEVDAAVQTYIRIADNARFSYQRREALADAARVRLQNGDAQAAADLYQDVVETFEEQEAGRGYYEMWLAEARAEAAEGAEAPTAVDSAATAPTADPAEADTNANG